VLNHAYESPRIVDAGQAAIRSGIARGVAITAQRAAARAERNPNILLAEGDVQLLETLDVGSECEARKGCCAIPCRCR
jgi:hypothetical protein